MKKSRFEDDDTPKFCQHPEHNPPMFMVIPPGQRYVHVCPSCGKETVLRPQVVTL